MMTVSQELLTIALYVIILLLLAKYVLFYDKKVS